MRNLAGRAPVFEIMTKSAGFSPYRTNSWLYREVPDQTPFASVFDVSHAGKIELTSLIEFDGQHKFSEQLKVELEALPTQEPGSFRFYVGEDTLCDTVFGSHVYRDTSVAIAPVGLGPPSFTYLRSQWQSPSNPLPWRSISYEAGDLDDLSGVEYARDPTFAFSTRLLRLSKGVCITKDNRGCYLGKKSDATLHMSYLTIGSLYNSNY